MAGVTQALNKVIVPGVLLTVPGMLRLLFKEMCRERLY